MLGLLALVLLINFTDALFSPSENWADQASPVAKSDSPEEQKQAASEGESQNKASEDDHSEKALEEIFVVGYWGYQVGDYDWNKQLDFGFGKERADGYFLRVLVALMNAADSSSTIPPFILEDDKGRKYSSETKLADGYLRPLISLNPGIIKGVFVVFDVPRQDYWLILDGGFLSAEKVRVRIKGSKKSNVKEFPR